MGTNQDSSHIPAASIIAAFLSHYHQDHLNQSQSYLPHRLLPRHLHFIIVEHSTITINFKFVKLPRLRPHIHPHLQTIISFINLSPITISIFLLNQYPSRPRLHLRILTKVSYLIILCSFLKETASFPIFNYYCYILYASRKMIPYFY